MLPHINQLHHAYLLRGSWKDWYLTIKKFGEKHQIPFEKKEYWMTFDIPIFSISQVRNLQSLQMKRRADSFWGIIVITQSIPQEAQNALLKLLEEPVQGSYFFFVVPTSVPVKDTIRSRTHELFLEYQPEQELSDTSLFLNVKKFLSSTPSQRMNTITAITKKYQTPEQKKELRSQVLTFIDETSQKFSLHKENTSEALQVLIFASQYLREGKSSVKMILEYLALFLPVYP